MQETLWAWDDWANRGTLASVRSLASGAETATRLLAHVAAARRIWAARVRHEPDPIEVWPDLSLDDIERELEAGTAEWREWLATASPADATVRYANSRGDAFESLAHDIFFHVLHHSTYHRGQIASKVVAAGGDPAVTDYIFARRSGEIGAP